MHCIEHFKEALNQPCPTKPMTAVVLTPNEFKIDLGDFPTRETQCTVGALKNNKATGLHEITAELLKHGRNSMVMELMSFLNECWQTECVLDEWRKVVIFKLPKMGNIMECRKLERHNTSCGS